MGSDTGSAASAVAGLVIRDALEADVADVGELERLCYRDPWPTSSFTSLPVNNQVYFAVARDGAGKLAGYVVGWFVLDEGEIANLAVTPELRSRGVGAALLDALIAHAEARGIARLYLEVRASNVAAQRLYAARRFEEVGRRKEYYRMPVEDALILRRTVER